MLFFHSRNQSIGSSYYAEKMTEEPQTQIYGKSAHSSVTLAYQTNIVGYWRNVNIVWGKNLINHYLIIMVSSLDGDFRYTCKIDLKPWHFWTKKGYKSFEVEGTNIEVFWDLRSAKFSKGPEPISDYYVALVVEEEVALLLGNYSRKAYKRTKLRPALVEPQMSYKKENVFAKKSFVTRCRFDERRKEHEILVESSTTGIKDPEMWISMDGVVLVHVRNLQWKFRGNQTILVDKQPMQVLWDVHDWLFASPGTGYGLLIFKPIASEAESEAEDSGHGGGSDTSSGSRYYTTKCPGTFTPEFCLFLHAWKTE